MELARSRRRSALRTLTLFCTALVALAASAGSAAGTTVVDRTDALIIDPGSEPGDQHKWRVSEAPFAAYIKSMQATKTVQSVTLGNYSQLAGCAGEPTHLRLDVREHANALNPDESVAITDSLGPAPAVPELPGRITWTIPPTTFHAGRGYSFVVIRDRSAQCAEIQQMTWPRGQVDGGLDPCAGGPVIARPQSNGGTSLARRMWAGSGNVPGCDDRSENNGSMGGWVVSRPVGSSWQLLTAFYTPGSPVPPGYNPCGLSGGIDLRDWGGSVHEWDGGSAGVDEYCRWNQWGPLGVHVHNGWFHGMPWWNEQPNDVYIRLGEDTPPPPPPPPPLTDDELVAKFRPRLHFDNSEKWRPVRLMTFFGETDSSGEPYHQVCRPRGTRPRCVPISGPEQLSSLAPAGGNVDVHGLPALNGSYHSPYSHCNENGLSDCDSGFESAAHYNVVRRPESGYRYLDYWYFYRFNGYSSHRVFNHEGDWEGMTVAVSPAGHPETFDFASFSQHGPWHNYLRENLRCDGNETGSCGSAGNHSGLRVDAFVANGSHANYADTCREIVIPCFQTNSGFLENGHDGSKSWGNNDAAPHLALERMPASGSWVDWPGQWGVDGAGLRGALPGGPSSPGNQRGHFERPWENECADDGCPVAPKVDPTRWSRTSPASVSARSCDGWFGGSVAAAVCSTGRLQAALKAGDVSGAAGPDAAPLTVAKGPGRRDVAAGGNGVAQLLAAPLRRGDKLVLKGAATAGSQVLVRALDGKYLVEAKFDPAALAKVASAKVTVRGRGRSLHVVLTRADGQTRRPAAVSRSRIR